MPLFVNSAVVLWPRHMNKERMYPQSLNKGGSPLSGNHRFNRRFMRMGFVLVFVMVILF